MDMHAVERKYNKVIEMYVCMHGWLVLLRLARQNRFVRFAPSPSQGPVKRKEKNIKHVFQGTA